VRVTVEGRVMSMDGNGSLESGTSAEKGMIQRMS
jgi:hypothetical protein